MASEGLWFTWSYDGDEGSGSGKIFSWLTFSTYGTASWEGMAYDLTRCNSNQPGLDSKAALHCVYDYGWNKQVVIGRTSEEE